MTTTSSFIVAVGTNPAKRYLLPSEARAEVLRAEGVAETRILVATGTHRAMTDAELIAYSQGINERMKEIKSRLAVLGTQFTQNLLADERDWQMELTEADLDGLPDFVIRAARAASRRSRSPCCSMGVRQ